MSAFSTFVPPINQYTDLSFEKIRAEQEAELARLGSDLDAARAGIAEFEKISPKLDNAREELKSLEAELVGKSNELSSVTKEISTSRAELEELNAGIGPAKSELSDVLEKSKIARSTLEKTLDDNEHASLRMKEVADSLSVENSKLEALSSERAKLESSVSSMRASYESERKAYEEDIERLRNEVADLRVARERDARLAVDAKDRYDSEKTRLEGMVSDLETTHADKMARYKDEEAKSAESVRSKLYELDVREGEISRKASALETERAKLSRAKAELEAFYQRKLNHINL